jgi:glycosyltransferase involved in cell wall biosynthesis
VSLDSLVTVVIAVRNGERYLAEALDSVLAQSYSHYEILVVDGGSSDRSVAIASAYPRVEVVPQGGHGLADAWNLGITRSRGDLVAFLDSDDRWRPHKLRRQVDRLAADPSLQLVDAHMRFFLEPGCAVPKGFRPELIGAEPVGHAPGTILARRSLFETIGGFVASLEIASDIDWFARVKDAHVALAVVPEVLLDKRVHGANLSLQQEGINRYHRELLRVFRLSVNRQAPAAESAG